MGPVGEAILFMFLFMALIVVGLYVLAYTARCVLVVVQETGMGQEEVVWPSEPVQDWLGHAVLFVELLAIWLVPAGLAARMLREAWLPGQGLLRVLLLAGPGLWLFFPIGLLSSLSASSRWVPFRWTILYQFLRITPAALGFYFLTAILLAAGVAPWYFAVARRQVLLLPVAALASGTAILIYARLLGRLTWLIQRLPSAPRPAARPREEKRPASKPQVKKKRKPIADVHDPWAVPEEEQARARAKKRFPWADESPPPKKAKSGLDIPSAEDIEGYGVAASNPADAEPPPEKPTRPSARPPAEDPEAIEMDTASPPEPPRSRESQTELFADQVRRHIAERSHHEGRPPAHPFFSGVYSFPWYSQCLSAWLALSVGALAVGGITYGLIDLGRTLFGW
jgi:hypothetical protein